jgi:hypothetical protein
VLAYMTFPKEHRVKIHSTNPIERLNGEIKRRTDVVGIFPNEDAITRLIGAILLEQNDEWAVQRARYMTLEPARASAAKPSLHSAIIPPSCCPSWLHDKPGQTAGNQDDWHGQSYTTSGDTIAGGAEPAEGGWMPLDAHTRRTPCRLPSVPKGTEGMPPRRGAFFLRWPVALLVRTPGCSRQRHQSLCQGSRNRPSCDRITSRATRGHWKHRRNAPETGHRSDFMERVLLEGIVIRDAQPHRPAVPLRQGDLLIYVTKPPECVHEIHGSLRRKPPSLICQKDQ